VLAIELFPAILIQCIEVIHLPEPIPCALSHSLTRSVSSSSSNSHGRSLSGYARCTTCGREARDVGAEPRGGVWWTSLEDGRNR
jgi:hypothetical protein